MNCKECKNYEPVLDDKLPVKDTVRFSELLGKFQQALDKRSWWVVDYEYDNVSNTLTIDMRGYGVPDDVFKEVKN